MFTRQTPLDLEQLEEALKLLKSKISSLIRYLEIPAYPEAAKSNLQAFKALSRTLTTLKVSKDMDFHAFNTSFNENHTKIKELKALVVKTVAELRQQKTKSSDTASSETIQQNINIWASLNVPLNDLLEDTSILETIAHLLQKLTPASQASVTVRVSKVSTQSPVIAELMKKIEEAMNHIETNYIPRLRESKDDEGEVIATATSVIGNLEACQKFLLSLYNVLADQTPSAPTRDLESTLGNTRTQLEAISQKIPARIGHLNVGFDSSQMSYFGLRQTIYDRMKELISNIERVQGVLFPTNASVATPPSQSSSAPPVQTTSRSTMFSSAPSPSSAPPQLDEQQTLGFFPSRSQPTFIPNNSTSQNHLSSESFINSAQEILSRLQAFSELRGNQFITELCESLKVAANSPFAKMDAKSLAETFPKALHELINLNRTNGKFKGIIAMMEGSPELFDLSKNKQRFR